MNYPQMTNWTSTTFDTTGLSGTVNVVRMGNVLQVEGSVRCSHLFVYKTDNDSIIVSPRQLPRRALVNKKMAILELHHHCLSEAVPVENEGEVWSIDGNSTMNFMTSGTIIKFQVFMAVNNNNCEPTVYTSDDVFVLPVTEVTKLLYDTDDNKTN